MVDLLQYQLYIPSFWDIFFLSLIMSLSIVNLFVISSALVVSFVEKTSDKTLEQIIITKELIK